MSISLGSTNFGSIYLGNTKIGEAYLGSVKVYPSGPTPIILPANTLRLKFTEGYTPTGNSAITYTQVSSSPNIWDVTNSSSNGMWNSIFSGNTNLLEVIATGDLSAATSMYGLFNSCTSLTSVADFTTTSNVTNFQSMFKGCSSLTNVPSVNITSATNAIYMFWHCTGVQSGALSFYQQLSSHSWPAYTSSHNVGCVRTFENCGMDTVSGLAELNQIPSNYGGNLRSYGNTYYIEIIPTALNTIAFAKLWYDQGYSRPSAITGGSYFRSSTGAWENLSSSDISNLNNGNTLKIYTTDLRVEFTYDADPADIGFYSGYSSSGIQSQACTATLYGTSVSTGNAVAIASASYTQANNLYIPLQPV